MKTFILTFSLLFSLNLFSQTITSWTGIADYAGNGRMGAVGFSINGIGYAGSGFPNGSTDQKDFYKYDPATNQWTRIADFGGYAFSYGYAAAVNGKGYAGLGGGPDWYQYDPSTNTWTQKANFPEASIRSSTGFVIGNNIYVGTGDIGGYSNKFWMYDTQNDTWTPKADFGGIARYGAVSFSINGKGYIGTGTKNYVQQSDFWEYDPSTNVWTEKASYPAGGIYYGEAFAIGNKGYLGMGLNQTNDPVSDFYQYDPATNTWTAVTSYPTTQFEAPVFVIGNYAYCGTGGAGGTSFYKFTTSDITTATTSAFVQNSHKIYPNPSNGNISIEADGSYSNCNIQIYNSIGQRVYQQAVAGSPALQNISLNALPSGIYELVMTDNSSNGVLMREKIILTK